MNAITRGYVFATILAACLITSTAVAQTYVYAPNNLEVTAVQGAAPTRPPNADGVSCRISMYPSRDTTWLTQKGWYAGVGTGPNAVGGGKIEVGYHWFQYSCPPPVRQSNQWICPPGTVSGLPAQTYNQSRPIAVPQSTSVACSNNSRIYNNGNGTYRITAMTGCAVRPNYASPITLSFPLSGNTLGIAASAGSTAYVNKTDWTFACQRVVQPGTCELCGTD